MYSDSCETVTMHMSMAFQAYVLGHMLVSDTQVQTVNSTSWTCCSQCLESTLDNLHLRLLLDVG